jgi:hypothetical protein
VALNLIDLKAFGERIAARDPDRQTAEIEVSSASHSSTASTPSAPPRSSAWHDVNGARGHHVSSRRSATMPIENSPHWVLDVTFDADQARNRKDNGPENLAILRRLTLNLLRTARPKLSISRKRKRSGWSDAFARSVIGQMR